MKTGKQVSGSSFESYAKLRERFGVTGALRHLASRVINRAINFQRLQVIVLERRNLKPADGEDPRLNARIASAEDLARMRAEGCWQLSDDKLGAFARGDACVLSYVGEALAGYTCVHERGQPTLIPGLTITVPEGYLYNYGAYTHPEFRGVALQSFRHRAVLSQERWSDKAGMVGYVRDTNFSSQRGQSKSGYQKVGTITLIGSHAHFAALLSPGVRRLGVRRVAESVPLPVAHANRG